MAVAEYNVWRPWLVGLLSALVVFMAAVVVMNQVGLLDIPDGGDEAGAARLAAALGLIGAGLTASVTLIGIVLKHSFDLRSHSLAMESEKRHRVDTVIKSVELLQPSDGRSVSKHAAQGSVLALLSLDEPTLAMLLLVPLEAEGLVGDAVAKKTLHAAVSSGDIRAGVEAARYLIERPELMRQPGGGFHWPPGGEHSNWDVGLPSAVRTYFLEAALVWLEWELKQGWNPVAATVFYDALDDPIEQIRKSAHDALDRLLENSVALDVDISIPFMSISTEAVRKKMRRMEPVSPEIRPLFNSQRVDAVLAT